MSVTLTQGWKFYIEEWLIPEKCDVYRMRMIAKAMFNFFGPSKIIEKITRKDLAAWRDDFVARGRALPTARKHLSIYFAMCRYNALHNDLGAFALLTLPPPSAPIAEAFEPQQVALLFAQEMPYRIRLFFTLDFETAARSKAMEQLTVGRCFWDRRVVDYRLPGVNHKKKRRGEVAMSDVLFPVLWEAAHRWGPPWKDDLIVPPGEPNSRRRSRPYDPKAVVRRSVSTHPGCLKVLKKCGLYKYWVVRHIGRKTWVTNAANNGATSPQISAVVHDTIVTIQKNYLFPKVDKQHGLMNIGSLVPAAVPMSP